MSVGANGGSFVVGYWNNIIFPVVLDAFKDSLVTIYHRDANLYVTKFNKTVIQSAGIYQLNNFLIKCKALLDIVCNDPKLNKLKSEKEYIKFSD